MDEIDDEMILMAESFHVSSVSRDKFIKTFRDLRRYSIFHKANFEMYLEQLLCTSSTINLHIKRNISIATYGFILQQHQTVY